MKQNLYQPINGGIVDIIDESPMIKSFVVVLEETFKFETGQFVERIRVALGHHENLRDQLHLVLHPHGELADDVRQSPDVMVREEDVDPEQEPERDVDVERDRSLDAGAQHLHDDIPALDGGTVHLTEARRGDRLVTEVVEQLGRPLRTTEDAREAQRAFVEKRPPRFSGR